jgi:alkaline phosphatase D
VGKPNSIRSRNRPPHALAGQDQSTSRRGFFARSGAALVAAPGLASVAQAQSQALSRGGVGGGTVFQHGVASGDPLADRVILWTRATPPAKGEPGGNIATTWVVATDPRFARVVAKGVAQARASADHTVKIDVTGLSAGTTYYYRFGALGQQSPIGRTRTLPSGADAQRLRLAVASCSNHAAGLFNAYRQIARRADLDAVIHLGDYLYEYGPNVYGSQRVPDPPFEMVSLSDYRRRHAQYKADVDSQAMHRQHPLIAIWDDHETTNDAWADGAENHTEGAEGTWPVRVADALRAYYEWMPIRQPDPSDPRRQQRAFRFGDLVDLTMLEQRLQARSQQLPATIPVPGLGTGFVQAGPFLDPSRTLLGADQEAWLAARLRGSPARWKLLGQGVMFAHLKISPAPLANGGGVFVNSDQWDGYQPARDRLYDVLKGTPQHPPVSNCVVLTGDIHSGWASDLTQDPNNPNPATGGYDAATGEGSRAVEFVATSITSPGLNDPAGTTAAFLRSVNPHIKYIDLNRRGYNLLDITRERVVCEFWTVDTVVAASDVQTMNAAFEVGDGTNRLRPSAMTTPPAAPPALAP